MEAMSRTVAVVQAEVPPAVDAALERTRQLARQAARDGASLIVFPETWIPGYPAWLDCCRDAALWDHPPVKAVFAEMAANSIVVNGESGDALRRIACDAGVTIVVGIVERLEHGPGRGTLYNALLTIGPDGSLLNHHRKLVPTYTERMLWGPGDAHGLRSVQTDAGRVGGLICWEQCGQGAAPVRAAALPPSSVHPRRGRSSDPPARNVGWRSDGSRVLSDWMPLARQALHDAGEDVHIASDDWVLRGGSAVIAPDGSYVAGPVFEHETILLAGIDLARVREENMTLDVSGHYSRPDLFRFSVQAQGSQRETNEAGG